MGNATSADTLAPSGSTGQGATPAPTGEGASLGPYRLRGLIGEGGMGRVYRAEHTLIGRPVAVKTLNPDIAADAEAVSRFFTEARAVNEIRHPNIVEVTDFGIHEGQPYLVMEYLEGETLDQRIARLGALPIETAVHVARQVASALGAAHDRGLIHRDLKPANIFLRQHPDYPDFVKVLDFGIAKLVGAERKAEHQTRVGALLGTPAYMSPEQCLGEPGIDHRSDVYSLGVVLFAMLAGRLPFQADTVGRLILCHVQEPPPAPSASNPGVPRALDAVVLRALAKDRRDRFESMREVRAALDAALGGAAPAPVTPPPVVVHRTPAAGRGEITSIGPVGGGAPSADAVVGRLVDVVERKLRDSDLALPALPPAAARCLEMLATPGFAFSAAAAAIRQDARLAAHVARVANDPFSARAPAPGLEAAVARLGASGLRAAVVEAAARPVLVPRHPRLEDAFRKPFAHALAGALVARGLAAARDAGDGAVDAHLAALLRDAGRPLVAMLLLDVERQMAGGTHRRWLTEDVWLRAIARTHRAAGAALCRHWGLGEPVADAVARGGAYEPAAGWSLGNVARLAGALADRAGFYLRRDDLADAEAAVEEGRRILNVDDRTLSRIIDRLKERVTLRE